MNTAPIVQRIGTRPVGDADGVLPFIQREAHPVLQALLRLVNRATTNTSTVTTSSITTDPQADLVLADASGGNLTLALPSPYDWVKRQVIVKTDASANTVTVTGIASGDQALATQWSSVEVMGDGSAYYRATGLTSSWSVSLGVVVLTGATNTLAFGHAAKWIRVNHTVATQLTVPPDVFPVGTYFPVEQMGAGLLEIVAGAGVTVNKPATCIRFAAEQSSVLGLLQVSLNTWVLFGDMGLT